MSDLFIFSFSLTTSLFFFHTCPLKHTLTRILCDACKAAGSRWCQEAALLKRHHQSTAESLAVDSREEEEDGKDFSAECPSDQLGMEGRRKRERKRGGEKKEEHHLSEPGGTS